MKRGLYLAPFDELADPRLLAELARVAESPGWDGLFVWDRIAYPPSDRAVGGTQRHRFQDGQPSYPVNRGRASPSGPVGAIAVRWAHGRSYCPCHPRAISSGHERYPAVNHGHSETTVALRAGH
jgi:hypothetical protein